MLATFAGLGAAVWAFGAAGLGEVLAATGRIGIGGFALFCLYSIASFLILGGAWIAAAPGVPLARAGAFCWARIVREGASDLLPFSQIGGLVVGARTLIGRGIRAPLVYASLVVDMLTEMAAQLVFTLAGIAMFALLLSANPKASALFPLIFGGAGVMVALMAAFFLFQRHGLRFASRIAAMVLPGGIAALDSLSTEIQRIHARPARIACAFLLNLAAWFASAAGAWIALRLMGVAIPFWGMITIESLIFTVRSVAFVIPGALGVQEAAYVLLGPLLGLSPASVLALSLVKRARDLSIGLPALLIWQWQEARTLIRERRMPGTASHS